MIIMKENNRLLILDVLKIFQFTIITAFFILGVNVIFLLLCIFVCVWKSNQVHLISNNIFAPPPGYGDGVNAIPGNYV